MKHLDLLLLLASCCAAPVSSTSVPPYIFLDDSNPHLFRNPPAAVSASYRIPSSYESAVLARRILALTPIGTISTTFPGDADDEGSSSDAATGRRRPGTAENRPAGVAGMPHALMEYIGDCESDHAPAQAGNPTMLAINVETSFKNIAAGSNVSLAVQWTPRFAPAKRIQDVPRRSLWDELVGWLGLGTPEERRDEDDDEEGAYEPVPYSAANLPRFSLLGYVERIPDGDDRRPGSAGAKLAECFVQAHPDSRIWLPGSRVHESHFVRLVVTQIYWVGGFGDRAYIGWIPVDEWQKVTRAEWESVRLPGEKKGWKEWSARSVGNDL